MGEEESVTPATFDPASQEEAEEFFEQFVGTSQVEFETEAERHGYEVRPLRVDGEEISMVEDVRFRRLNISVSDGIVDEIIGVF